MTRHQLKERDEITTSLQSFTELVMARKKEVTIGLSALAALIIIFFGWRYYSSSRDANAQTQLSQVILIYNDAANIKSDKERYEKTIVEAQKTYDRYGSLPVGKIAPYSDGMSQEGLGDTAKATQTLQQVIQSGDASVKAVAQFALAGIYKKHGDLQKAIETYKQLYDGADIPKPLLHSNSLPRTKRTSRSIKRRISTRNWCRNFRILHSASGPMML